MVGQRIIMDARKAKMEMMKHMQMGKEAVQEIIVRSRSAGEVNLRMEYISSAFLAEHEW